MIERHHRLRQARRLRGLKTAALAAAAFGWNRYTYTSNENGNAPFSYRRAKDYARAFGVEVEWLYDGQGSMLPSAGMARIIGHVGANPDGVTLFALGQTGNELVPLPPGGAESSVALLVAGQSMPGLADEGALIYFEDQRTPPSPDMLGHVVVVELESDEVLVKRLLRGSRPGLFNLESLVGETRQDVKVRWAAHVTAIIPPFQARRIIRSVAA